MNKFTIQQLQQMRESEDRVEFKAGEGGNVSYDGRGRTNPKDRRRCILGYVIDTQTTSCLLTVCQEADVSVKSFRRLVL